MARRPCLELGCPKLVRSGRCRAHARAHAAARAVRPGLRIYDDPRWQTARAQALLRAGRRCQAALADGSRCPVATRLHAHHDYPGGVVQMLRDGADPFSVRRIVMFCEAHHVLAEAALRRGRSLRRG